MFWIQTEKVLFSFEFLRFVFCKQLTRFIVVQCLDNSVSVSGISLLLGSSFAKAKRNFKFRNYCRHSWTFLKHVLFTDIVENLLKMKNILLNINHKDNQYFEHKSSVTFAKIKTRAPWMFSETETVYSMHS